MTGNVNTMLNQAVPPDWPVNYWIHWLVFTVIIIGFVLTIVMGFIYFERRALARMQSRLGPNRTGPFGLLQPVADAIKVLLKEDSSLAMETILFSVLINQQLTRD